MDEYRGVLGEQEDTGRFWIRCQPETVCLSDLLRPAVERMVTVRVVHGHDGRWWLLVEGRVPVPEEARL